MATLFTCLFVAALHGDALLVSTDHLAGVSDALVVDARPLEAYAAGHIPGAAHLDVASLSETRDGVAGLLKPPAQVREALGAAGIDPAKHIVVYCGLDEADEFKDAARLFWILEYVGYERVSILDGGFAKWKAEGWTVEEGAPRTAAIEVPKLTLHPEHLATLKQVEAAIKDGKAQVADLRSAEYYRGEKTADIVKEPGHIPSANNLPAAAFLSDTDRTIKPVGDLEALVESDGIQKDRAVITYCNSGRAASVGYFVMRLVGRDNVSMYDGSMAEWTAKGKKTVSDGGGK